MSRCLPPWESDVARDAQMSEFFVRDSLHSDYIPTDGHFGHRACRESIRLASRVVPYGDAQKFSFCIISFPSYFIRQHGDFLLAAVFPLSHSLALRTRFKIISYYVFLNFLYLTYLLALQERGSLRIILFFYQEAAFLLSYLLFIDEAA